MQNCIWRNKNQNKYLQDQVKIFLKKFFNKTKYVQESFILIFQLCKTIFPLWIIYEKNRN